MNSGYYKVRTNDRNLHNEKEDGDITCYVSLLKKKDRKRYINEDMCKVKDECFKVITSEASGKGSDGFGFMTIAFPQEIYTDSYIGFRVKNEQEGESLISYLKCDLPNFLLASRKISQHISTSTIKWIPLPPLDRIWTNELVNEYFN
jgi:hypothetical protein